MERQRMPLKSRVAYKLADELLADPYDRKYYADQCSCWPPPLFIPFVTLVELGFFIYYAVSGGEISANGPVPVDSMFIYRSDKRIEVWRFLLYVVVHAGWLHLLFNLVVQLVVGLPLEMVHGSFRTAVVYISGVLAGSLATSVFDSSVYLVGASGGVYALLAAHAANVLLNYSQIAFPVVRVFVIIITASMNVGYAIWDRYASTSQTDYPVSYMAHLAGAGAGLTIGLLVLRNFEQRLNEQFIWWVALSVYCACMLTAIIWNIFFI